VIAPAAPLDPRFVIQPLYRERFVLAFPAGHRFAALAAVPLAEVAGETYLSRINCEQQDRINALCRERGFDLAVGYKSEREDWIQTMVMAGMGICFTPQFSPVLPGLLTRPVVEPEVVREVPLVTVAGRRYSPAVLVFIKAIGRYGWPAAAEPAA
jgi:DNA-binding transcriptional LysR family regulator